LHLATLAEVPRTIWGLDLKQIEPFQLVQTVQEGCGVYVWTGYVIAPALNASLRRVSPNRLELPSQGLIPADLFSKSHTESGPTPLNHGRPHPAAVGDFTASIQSPRNEMEKQQQHRTRSKGASPSSIARILSSPAAEWPSSIGARPDRGYGLSNLPSHGSGGAGINE
jgi:hypothetical protein